MTNFISSIFGRKTNPVAPATQLRVQSSINGTPIPIGWGTARIAPNLIYYNDFRSAQIQQQTGTGGGKGGTTGGGGKFGGGGTQTVYYATVICGLCEGPIAAIGTVWSSNNLTSYPALNFGLLLGTYTQTAWSYIVSAHPADARAYRGTAYVAAAPFSLGNAPALPSLNFEVAFAFSTGSPPDPGVNVGSGIMINGGTGTIIIGPGPGNQDCNPATIINDFLTNQNYGLKFPASRIGDSGSSGNLDTLWQYCQAVGIWMSPVLVQQKSANTFLADILYGCVADAVWSGGKLKVVPYYDAAASANGGNYAPNLSPIYALTDDNFIPGTNNNYQSPVIVTVKALTDTYNSVKIQYNPRTNFYNPAIVEASDSAAIQQWTLRTRDTKTLDFFCRADSPQTCANLQLGREQVKITYQFSLPAQFVLLEPMDLVSLTDAALGLSNKLVRIKEITENQDFTLTIVAEDMLLGSASPPLYSLTQNIGAIANYGADPGQSWPPFFFEPTLQFLSGTGGSLEVMMAVEGLNFSTWGGANVYVSYDGINYQFVGQQLGPSRMGVTTAAFPAVTPATTPPTIDDINILSVNMSAGEGVLLSATHNDTLAFAPLCYLQGEFLAYETVTPTGAYKYNLNSLARGGYGTTPQSSAKGAIFVRVDAGVFRIPYTQDRIGQTIYVKLVNFNQYGSGPQTLSSVSPYTYTIQGTALNNPLPNVTNFTTNFQSNITLFSWTEVVDTRAGILYEIRKGGSWATAQVIGRFAHPNIPAPGNGTYLIMAVVQPVPGLLIYSTTPTVLTISGAVIPLNIIKTWDEFLAGLLGTYGGYAANVGGTIEIQDPLADIYTIADIYTVANVYEAASASTPVTGTYTIPSGHIINVGRVEGCLVDCSWSSEAIPLGQNIFTWGDIFSITDIFGAYANQFITVYANINISQDGSTWAGWQLYVPGFYTGMAFQVQLFLATMDPNTIASASSFIFAVHMQTRIDHYIGLSVGTGGYSLTFQKDGTAVNAAFNAGTGGNALPTWQATITNEQFGDQVNIASLTLSGCTITVTNNGVNVARVINIEFAGY